MSLNIRNHDYIRPHFPLTPGISCEESRWHKHDQCSTQAQPCGVQSPKELRQGRLDGGHLSNEDGSRTAGLTSGLTCFNMA